MAAFPYINIPSDAARPLTGSENVLLAQDGVLRKTSVQSIADLVVDPPVVIAGELFVSTNGSDATGTGTLSAPFASISAALAAASASYSAASYVRINVAPGDFTTPLSITRARTSIVGANASADDKTTKLGPVTVDCSSAVEKFQDTVALSGLFIQSTTAQPALKITGTGLFTVDVSGCYVTTTVADQNAILCDATNASKPGVYLKNCVVTKQIFSSADVIRFSRGDVQIDTTRVYASVSGTGHGIVFENNAEGFMDRALVDVSTTGTALRVNLALAIATPPVIVTNSSLKAGGVNAPCLYLANTLGPAALVWQTLFTKTQTGGTEYAITGVANGVPSYTLLSGLLTFVSNSVINTVVRVDMSIV
jgi:hypothetical protein